ALFAPVDEAISLRTDPSYLPSKIGVNGVAESASHTLRSVAFDYSTFVAVGDAILTSSDGVAWSPQAWPWPLGRYSALFGVAGGGGVFVRAGWAGGVITLTHGGPSLPPTPGTTSPPL